MRQTTSYPSCEIQPVSVERRKLSRRLLLWIIIFMMQMT